MACTEFDHHMNLHYSQTTLPSGFCTLLFDHHMNLHYSQTKKSRKKSKSLFDHHMNLHYSQTFRSHHGRLRQFDHHMNLHYSQTSNYFYTISVIIKQTSHYISGKSYDDFKLIISYLYQLHKHLYQLLFSAQPQKKS